MIAGGLFGCSVTVINTVSASVAPSESVATKVKYWLPRFLASGCHMNSPVDGSNIAFNSRCRGYLPALAGFVISLYLFVIYILSLAP